MLRPKALTQKAARSAIIAARTIQSYKIHSGTDKGTCLCDILADLMHWCDVNNLDFTHNLALAQSHYEAERKAGNE